MYCLSLIHIYRRLIGFATRVGEERLLKLSGGKLRKLLGQPDDPLILIQRGGMSKEAKLLTDCCDHLWMTVA